MDNKIEDNIATFVIMRMKPGGVEEDICQVKVDLSKYISNEFI